MICYILFPTSLNTLFQNSNKFLPDGGQRKDPGSSCYSSRVYVTLKYLSACHSRPLQRTHFPQHAQQQSPELHLSTYQYIYHQNENTPHTVPGSGFTAVFTSLHNLPISSPRVSVVHQIIAKQKSGVKKKEMR